MRRHGIILFCSAFLVYIFFSYIEPYLHPPGGLGISRGFPFAYYRDTFKTAIVEFDQPIYKYINFLIFFVIFYFIGIKISNKK